MERLPDALVDALQGMGPTLERTGLEACSPAAWLHEGLTQAGLPAICIEARRACKLAGREGFAQAQDRIIIVAGVPFGAPGANNMTRIAVLDAGSK